VNWSCYLCTALSDIEVDYLDITKPIKRKVLWRLRKCWDTYLCLLYWLGAWTCERSRVWLVDQVCLSCARRVGSRWPSIDSCNHKIGDYVGYVIINDKRLRDIFSFCIRRRCNCCTSTRLPLCIPHWEICDASFLTSQVAYYC
jgi:hypothetical protein